MYYSGSIEFWKEILPTIWEAYWNKKTLEIRRPEENWKVMKSFCGVSTSMHDSIAEIRIAGEIIEGIWTTTARYDWNSYDKKDSISGTVDVKMYGVSYQTPDTSSLPKDIIVSSDWEFEPTGKMELNPTKFSQDIIDGLVLAQTLVDQGFLFHRHYIGLPFRKVTDLHRLSSADKYYSMTGKDDSLRRETEAKIVALEQQISVLKSSL